MKVKGEIVVLSGSRTSFGKFGGKYKDVDIFDLGAETIKSIIAKSGISKSQIDEVWWGVGDTLASKDMYTPVTARQTLLKAGLSPNTPSVSIDKACVSAMSSAYYASGRILFGEIDIAVAGGATSFSNIPYVLKGVRFSGKKMGDISINDPLFMLGYKDFNPVAVDASNVSIQFNISRQEQDEFAYLSHRKYGIALEKGYFKSEIVGIRGVDHDEYMVDEQYRSNISVEKLKGLKTIYGSDTCTAGNAPGLNDGAAAQLLTTKKNALDNNWKILYSILSINSIAIDPNMIAVAPAFAIKRCLEELNMSILDIDLIEINEAFACVPLVSLKLLSNSNFLESDYDAAVENIHEFAKQPYDGKLYEELKEKTNVNGGAIAIGHPNTATGARLMMTAGYELQRRGGGIAVTALCGGLAQADACVIKV